MTDIDHPQPYHGEYLHHTDQDKIAELKAAKSWSIDEGTILVNRIDGYMWLTHWGVVGNKPSELQQWVIDHS